MDFGGHLEKLIRERNLSINMLVRECGINRGGLYNAFKGQRKLKADQLFALISKLSLSAPEEARLINMYFDDFYGEQEHGKIKFLINQISDCAPARHNAESVSKSSAAEEKLKAFISQNKRIITNFPYSFEAADRLFFNAVQNGEITEFTHILVADDEDDYKNNYISIFKSLKYMYFGHFPKYFHSSVKALQSAALLPYFAIGESGALLFSKARAVAIEDSESVDILAREAAELLRGCRQFGEESGDIFQIKDEYQKGIVDGMTEVTLSSYPCLAQFVDYETMQSLVRRQLPNKDMLVEIAYSHYSNIYKRVKQINITTEDGIKRFASTGNLLEIPGKYIACADIKHRVKILEGIADSAKRGEFYLLDKSKLSLPGGIMIEKCANKGILCAFDENEKDFYMFGRFFAQLEDRAFVESLGKALKYLVESRKVYPKEYTAQFIKNTIAGLKPLEQ